MSLRLGDVAPDFEAETSQGPIKFSEFAKDSWVLFFSHPDDYTPVCTTELSALSREADDFSARGVKLLGLSANDVDSHHGWIKDINQFGQTDVDFPIVADKTREVAVLYGMLDQQDKTNIDAKGIPFTVRSVFILDPNRVIRLILTYPASTGRNFAEIKRVIDSLQLGDKYKITTPANWRVAGTDGTDKVIVHPSVQGEKVKELFGDDVDVVFPYLRFTSDPSKKATKAVNGTNGH